VNLLTGARKLARVSKTPGRTQLVNFFSVAEERRLVDLPGYGFARVAPDVQARWQRLIETYLRERRSLVGLVITMDIRRGVTRLDDQLLRWLEPRGLPIAVLLTKADKLSRGAGMQRQREIGDLLGGGILGTHRGPRPRRGEPGSKSRFREDSGSTLPECRWVSHGHSSKSFRGGSVRLVPVGARASVHMHGRSQGRGGLHDS
jgi:hypothetical protein